MTVENYEMKILWSVGRVSLPLSLPLPAWFLVVVVVVVRRVLLIVDCCRVVVMGLVDVFGLLVKNINKIELKLRGACLLLCC